jgi:tetratricopeptide (TPR) repeat protein
MFMWKKIVLFCFIFVIVLIAIKVHYVHMAQAAYQMSRIDEADRFLQEGNRLLKEGLIDDALKNYGIALEIRPNWDIALDNIKAANISINHYKEILDVACTNQVIYEENGLRYLLMKKGDSVELKRLDASNMSRPRED